MKNRVIGAVLFLLGLLALLTPRYVLPVCEYQGFQPMSCSHTGTAGMFMGFVIMTASAGIFLSKSYETLRWSSLTILTAGLSLILIPEAIGYCHSSMMPCNYGTMPALRLTGALIILVSITGCLLSLKKRVQNM